MELLFPTNCQDIDFSIMLYLDLDTLKNMCTINKYVNMLFNTPHFWCLKLSKELDYTFQSPPSNSKGIYTKLLNRDKLLVAVQSGNLELVKLFIGRNVNVSYNVMLEVLKAVKSPISLFILDYMSDCGLLITDTSFCVKGTWRTNIASPNHYINHDVD
jgi:hypothetical protein